MLKKQGSTRIDAKKRIETHGDAERRKETKKDATCKQDKPKIRKAIQNAKNKICQKGTNHLSILKIRSPGEKIATQKCI